MSNSEIREKMVKELSDEKKEFYVIEKRETAFRNGKLFDWDMHSIIFDSEDLASNYLAEVEAWFIEFGDVGTFFKVTGVSNKSINGKPALTIEYTEKNADPARNRVVIKEKYIMSKIERAT